MAIVEARNLTKVYGRQAACREVCLSVEEGQVFGLLGPNGAGKSTLVKMLVGLVHPTAGEARIGGYAPGDSRARRQLGFLPENFRLHGWFRGYELLVFHARLAGLNNQEAKVQAERVLELVGLEKEGRKLIAQYSKGMQQRLALGAALVGNPRVVFLDEPTSALDPLGRRQVREILLSLKQSGMTVFLNSHLLSEVEQVCDQVAVISRGRVMACGYLADMLNGHMEITLRVAELKNQHLQLLKTRYPSLRVEGDCLTVRIDDQEDIPELVENLVAEGCRIYEVIPRHHSLEEIFMELVREGEEACG